VNPKQRSNSVGNDFVVVVVVAVVTEIIEADVAIRSRIRGLVEFVVLPPANIVGHDSADAAAHNHLDVEYSARIR